MAELSTARLLGAGRAGLVARPLARSAGRVSLRARWRRRERWAQEQRQGASDVEHYNLGPIW
eukprot:831300-Pyramimonas_sp.AAC.1